MRVCILMGSPRKNGNTNALRLPFQDELEQMGHTVTAHWLYGLDIRPCTACRTCTTACRTRAITSAQCYTPGAY